MGELRQSHVDPLPPSKHRWRMSIEQRLQAVTGKAHATAVGPKVAVARQLAGPVHTGLTHLDA